MTKLKICLTCCESTRITSVQVTVFHKFGNIIKNIFGLTTATITLNKCIEILDYKLNTMGTVIF